jgi:hypothetical protein
MSRNFILFFVLFVTGAALGCAVAPLVPLEAVVLPPFALDVAITNVLALQATAGDLLAQGSLLLAQANRVVQPVIAQLVDLSNELLMTRASYWKSPPATTALPLLAAPAALLVVLTIVVRRRLARVEAVLPESQRMGQDRSAERARAARCGEPAGPPFWWVDMTTRLPPKLRAARPGMDRMRRM